MKKIVAIVGLVFGIYGCASPKVQLVDPKDSADGVRVRKVIPYEIFIYAVDNSGTLILKDWKVENLPDPHHVYSVNYDGAVVSSTKFKLTLHENGGLNNVHVETSRTLKETAEAAKASTEEYLKGIKAKKEAEEEERKRSQKELLERIQAIKEYRSLYQEATSLPSIGGEPVLPDGTSLPGNE